MKKCRKWLNDEDLKKFRHRSDENPLLRALANRERQGATVRPQ